MIVPLQWFIENPFQNWTRTSSQAAPADLPVRRFRDAAGALAGGVEARGAGGARMGWPHGATGGGGRQRARVEAAGVGVGALGAGPAFDLGCKVREAMYALMARDYPQFLPRQRQVNTMTPAPKPAEPNA
jgi:hypothetical protein